MTNTNVEIEAQLDALTDLCCDAVEGDRPMDEGRVEKLVRALLMSGFEQRGGKPLSARLEERVRERCGGRVVRHAAAIEGITQKVQHAYDHQVRWHSQQPGQGNQTKPANISSATDA